MRSLTALIYFLIAGPVFAVETGGAAGGETEAAAQEMTAEESAAREVADTLEEPLYNPFVERYVLDELKSLRQDMSNNRADLIQQIVDREISVSDKAISYATNTVTYFFYLIAAVSSILVIIGWTSIREIKEKVHGLADAEINKLIQVYEQRLRAIEKQLTQKTKHIDENREEIEKTNELHALWLRVGLEHNPGAKIAVYDEILKRRPKDYEALTYKADAVLELGEPQWAVTLCHQALEIDPEFSHAFYQLACAKAALGQLDEAVQHLSEAFDRMDILDESLLDDPALEPLQDYQPFKDFIERSTGAGQ
jgi:tetratricopeptide (TPR) repeat protein